MKSKYEKDFKCEVIDKGLISEVAQAKKLLYFDNCYKQIEEETGLVYTACDSQDWFNYLIENSSNSQIDCALRLLRSKIRKGQKVREKIGALILRKEAIFLTLTFEDKVFENTTQETRRRYVARFLKQVSSEYVANIDFSPDINREHYHAVVVNRVNLNAWQYGFAYAEKIRCHKNDLTRVSKYLTKLTAHALKIDATRLIYSRS